MLKFSADSEKLLLEITAAIGKYYHSQTFTPKEKDFHEWINTLPAEKKIQHEKEGFIKSRGNEKFAAYCHEKIESRLLSYLEENLSQAAFNHYLNHSHHSLENEKGKNKAPAK